MGRLPITMPSIKVAREGCATPCTVRKEKKSAVAPFRLTMRALVAVAIVMSPRHLVSAC